MMKEVIVKCPATVANLVCGFDILGMALTEPYDIMKLKLIDEPKIIIINKDAYNLPTEPEKNVAGVVLLEIMEKMGNQFGFEVVILNGALTFLGLFLFSKKCVLKMRKIRGKC